MIKEELSALRKRTVQEFCRIMEFKALTDFAYMRALQTATNDTLTIGYETFGPYLGVADRLIHGDGVPRQIKQAKDDYFLSLVHQQQVAIFEHILFGTLRIVLIGQPIRLPKERKIEYSVILSSATKEDILRAMVDRELNELKYRNVEEWFSYIEKQVSSCAVSVEDVGRISEAKATRDVIVHNGGIVNSTYIRKSGTSARFAIDQAVEVSGNYTLECWQIFSRVLIYLIDGISNALI